MTPEALAALHREAFGRGPRPWSATEFAALLADAAVVVVAVSDLGFALGRAAAGEAELMTLAVAAAARRRGLGRRLLARFEAAAAARGAEAAFLEVAEDNAPARALYLAAGWVEAGRRRRYYARGDGTAADAIVMRKALGGTAGGAGANA